MTLAACGGGGAGGAQVDGYNFPVRDSKFNGVTAYYGPLLVREGELSGGTTVMPWTGYWLPDWDTYLFESKNGDLSPLEKYDAFVEKIHGQPSDAANYERNRLDRNFVGLSDGHCDAWALAAIMAPSPTHCAKIRGIEFSISDLRSLLVDSYEKYTILKTFGFNNRTSDMKKPEMYPDQFQKAIEAEVIEKQRPLIIDWDHSSQVWNVPVDEATFQMERDSSDPHVMHVTAFITAVSAATENAIAKTPEYDGPPVEVNYIYTYDLYGEPQTDGSLLVRGGEWTGRSAEDHPDYVASIDDSASTEHSSLNPQVSTEMVNEILAWAEDPRNQVDCGRL
jgi:hypothetical protein